MLAYEHTVIQLISHFCIFGPRLRPKLAVIDGFDPA